MKSFCLVAMAGVGNIMGIIYCSLVLGRREAASTASAGFGMVRTSSSSRSSSRRSSRAAALRADDEETARFPGPLLSGCRHPPPLRRRRLSPGRGPDRPRLHGARPDLGHPGPLGADIFGIAGFFGLGAYAAVLADSALGLSPVLSILAAGAAAALVAAFLGFGDTPAQSYLFLHNDPGPGRDIPSVIHNGGDFTGGAEGVVLPS